MRNDHRVHRVHRVERQYGLVLGNSATLVGACLTDQLAERSKGVHHSTQSTNASIALS